MSVRARDGSHRLLAALLVLLGTGCFEYETQLQSTDSELPDEALADPGEDLSEPFEPSEDFVDDPTVDVLPDDPFVDEPSDFEDCFECDDIPESGSKCSLENDAILACEDGCLEAQPCEPATRCVESFMEGAWCERCTPCDEPGRSFCGLLEIPNVLFECNENFCLVPSTCAPGEICMKDRLSERFQPNAQCVTPFDGCEEFFCSGVRICGESEEFCRPCGCCDPETMGDFCGSNLDHMVTFQSVPSFDCYQANRCEGDEVCKLSDGGATAFCSSF